MDVSVMSAFTGATTPDVITAAGRLAEERGFRGFWVPEHVLFFKEYESRYPYAPDGKIPGNPTGVLEPFIALTWIAAATTKIRLGTGICLIPQRNPVYAAKEVADVDYLSGGRVDLGVGIGWLKEEFDALYVPFDDRAKRTLEHLEVMKALWTQEVSSYEGELYTLPPSVQGPKPVQKPHPPIHFGGNTEPAFKRVATAGDGWYGFNLTPQDFGQKRERIETLAREAGRDPKSIRYFISPPAGPVDADAMKAYRDAGADELIALAGARSVDKFEGQFDAVAEAAAKAA